MPSCLLHVHRALSSEGPAGGTAKVQAQRRESRTGEGSPGLAGKSAGRARPPRPGKQSPGRTGWAPGGGLQEARREGDLCGSWQPSSHTTRSFFQGTECLLWPSRPWPSPGLTVEPGHRDRGGYSTQTLAPRVPGRPERGPQGPRQEVHGCPGDSERSLPTHTCCPLPALGHIETPLQAARPAAALPRFPWQPPSPRPLQQTPHLSTSLLPLRSPPGAQLAVGPRQGVHPGASHPICPARKGPRSPEPTECGV